MPTPNRQRHQVSPFAQQAALLEPIVQPLYSSFAYAAGVMPREAQCFRYSVGGTVASNGTGPTATQIHTNMEAQGQLPQPKTFKITGIRVLINELASTLTTLSNGTGGNAGVVVDVGAAGIPSGDASFKDLLALFWGTQFRLFIGTKDYVVCPTSVVPGNTGLAGFATNAGLANSTAAFGAAVAPEAWFWSASGHGKYYGTGEYPIILPPQQAFFASLNCPQATPPTLVYTRLATILLDGVLGREAQ